MRLFSRTVRALTLGALFSLILSQEAVSQTEHAEANDRAAVTEHTVIAQGRASRYTAHAGFLTLRDAQNEVRGKMFYVFYHASEHPDHARPVLFAWNGGPGSSASQLDLGGIGPRLLSRTAGAEGAFVDNPDSWLRFADLVFIDPIGTGYSYAATRKDQETFFSDDGDADSVAEFIRLFRVHYRWTEAPVYMLGESYGTFRASRVADLLTQRDIMPAGIILLSTVFQPQMDSNLRASFLLPNFVATALGRRQHEQDVPNFTAEVNASEEWSRTTYLPALIAGERLPSYNKAEIASHLEQITGVSAAVWTAHHLVLSADEFATAVAGGDGTLYAGHYDTRLTGVQDKGAGYDVSRDPSLQTMHDLDAAMPTYLDRELRFHSDAFFAGPFGGRWPGSIDDRSEWTSALWHRIPNADASQALATAMRRDADLRVLGASGYFDLSTPFAESDYAFAAPGLFPSDSDRLRVLRYAGGHAIYMTPAVRKQFTDDAETFIAHRGFPAASIRLSSRPHT